MHSGIGGKQLNAAGTPALLPSCVLLLPPKLACLSAIQAAHCFFLVSLFVFSLLFLVFPAFSSFLKNQTAQCTTAEALRPAATAHL